MSHKKMSVWPFIVLIALCLAVASFEGWITVTNTGSWYANLHKPFFNPPTFVFGPVWVVLYIMIGIAGGLLWHQRASKPLLWKLFIIQLIFNFLWSPLFFAMHHISLALIDIILLWLTLWWLLIYAAKHYRPAFWWLLPYGLWVSFAAILTASLWVLN